VNLALHTRLRYIDHLLDHFGYFNRSMLVDYFGLSIPQVSLDIAKYIKACPKNCVYDKTLKRYTIAQSYKRKFL